jgi:hypothetical protein
MLHEWFLYVEGIAGRILLWLGETPCVADVVTVLRTVFGWAG